jgi:hypothetical protein
MAYHIFLQNRTAEERMGFCKGFMFAHHKSVQNVRASLKMLLMNFSVQYVIATRMYLEWWFDNIRYYLNGFKSYIDAQRKAVSIEADINNYSFKPEKYKVNVYAAKNQFPLFLKIPAITEGHYYSENLKRFLVVLLSVHSGFQ